MAPPSNIPQQATAATQAPGSWSVAQHDTIPQVDMWFNFLDTHVYLSAFLEAEGTEFKPPYSALRERILRILADTEARKRKGQAPSEDVKDQRIRTWKSTFEDFGLLQVAEADGRIKLTRLGTTIKNLYHEINQKLEGANDHLAKIGVEILNRHALRNPIDTGAYPEDSDLRPFHLIWKAMRQLDNKLHSEELNRVLMKINYRRQEDDAIAHIRQVRAAVGGLYTDTNLHQLGAPAVEQGEQTKRRLTPWFTRAGFGGLLISAFDDEQGYRTLNSKYFPIIDEAIQKEITVPTHALASRSAYLEFLTAVPSVLGSPPTASDTTDIRRVTAAAKTFGSTKIICLSGLPGTGKTRLAGLSAQALTHGDPYRFAEIQFHENTSYSDFMEGFVPKASGSGFELLPKVFRILNRRACLDPENATFVLLIEEFTRANIHALLGELLTYIEHRNRPFRLAVSQDEIVISPNLVILATMNPRDKSALTLDHALIRRMHIVECAPSAAALKSMLESKLDAALLEQLTQWFTKHINALPFGHGVFELATSAQSLRSIWAGTLRHFLTDVTGAVKPQYLQLVEEYPWK